MTEREASICASPLGRSYNRLARRIAKRAADVEWDARADAFRAIVSLVVRDPGAWARLP